MSGGLNISPLQFLHCDLAERVAAALTETGLSPSRLELEITESAFISDPDRAISMLTRLRSLGTRIAMDDFGTGWSTLASLLGFSFDKVKIDRSFIGKLMRHSDAETIV